MIPLCSRTPWRKDRCPRSVVWCSRILLSLGVVGSLGLPAGCRRESQSRSASANPADHAAIPEPSPGAIDPALTTTEDLLPHIPGFDPRSLTGREKALMELADPLSERAAWSSEALSAEATAQLKALAHVLVSADVITEESLTPLIAEAGTLALPSPAHFEEIFRDDLRVVRRTKPDAPVEPPVPITAAALQSLMAPHAGASEVRVALKNFRFAEIDGTPVTTAFFQSSGVQARGATQQNAVWTCRWSTESPPRLQAVAVSASEIVEPVNPPDTDGGLRFADVTGAVAGETPSLRDQMTMGAGFWAGRLEKYYQIDTTGHQGLALGDVDGDGLDDLYVLQQGGLPNRLYLQQNDGTLKDVSVAAGVDWMELSHAALFVDLDNDGDQDLVISQSIQILIMENLGRATFEVRHRFPGTANYFSLAAADYDHDGDLDVYACGYGRRDDREYADGARVTVPLPYHDSRNGGANVLLQNDGGWRFSDATVAAGLDQNNDRHSFAAAWEDYDNDGDLDLYVANDFGRNNLYQNQGPGADGQVRFRDVAAAAGVEDMSAGMGVVWGDFNRDGHVDLHVSNMFSAAGNRVAYQRQFRTDGDTETLESLRRHARGNSLFQNNGDGTFSDVSVEAGVTMGRWAWGAQGGDLNNDGWPDLFVVNGYITGETKDDL